MNSFPYNSKITYDSDGKPSYDRPIDADVLRAAFSAFFSNGVFYANSSSLLVEAPDNDTMTVNINPGQAHINGVVGNETQMRSLEIEASDETYPRIDRIVCRLNDNQAARVMDLYVVKGAPATVPDVPAPTQDGNIYDLVLADVYVVPNATRISADRITDRRLDEEVCGIVTANPEHISTEDIFNQFQGALDEYLELVDKAIDETLAGQLQTQIEALESRLDTDVQSVALGGTGATTAAAARTNLGVKACGTYATLPIANGGTGATAKVDAKDNLGIKYAGVAAAARGSNSSLSLSAGTITQVTLNTWISRTDTSFSFYGGGIKCPYSGTVMINASAYVVSNSTSSIARGGIYLYDSSDSEITGNYSGYSGQGINISTLIDVSAGDIIYLKVRNSLAGTCATNNGATYLGIQYIK